MSFYDWFTKEWKDLTLLPKEVFLYGPRHVFALMMIVMALCILVLVFYDRKKEQQDKVFNWICYLLIAEEILVRVARMTRIIVEGTWTFQNVYAALVPSFLCSIVVWLLIIDHFTKWKPLSNASAITGLIATGGFYLWASVGFNTVELSMIQLYSITTHAMALIYFLLQVIFKRVEFPLKKIYEPWILFAAVTLYSLFLNLFVFPGANYLYFMYDNMTWWAIPAPYWQVFLFVFLFSLNSIFYVPGIIKTWAAKRKEKTKTA